MVVRKRCALFAGLAAAGALAGCGGGGGETSAVEATVRTAVLSHDAAKCTEVMTAALHEEVSGKSGKDALEECREEAVEDKHDTKAVAVSNVKIDGAHATAEAAYAGGTFGGQTIEVSLVESEGRWKLDQVVRITEFDRKRFLAGTALAIADKEASSPDQRRCVVARLGDETQKEIEAVLILHSDEEAEIQLARECPNSDYHQSVNAQIAEAVKGLALGGEPSLCVEFATQDYLESTSGKTGNEAIAACAMAQEADLPESAKVSDIRVDGPEATAKVATRNDGEEDAVAVLGLVREFGHWKVDRHVRLLSINRLAFSTGVLEGFTESGIEVNPAVSECVQAKVRRIPLRQFEELIFHVDTELGIELFRPCAEAGVEAPPVS